MTFSDAWPAATFHPPKTTVSNARTTEWYRIEVRLPSMLKFVMTCCRGGCGTNAGDLKRDSLYAPEAGAILHSIPAGVNVKEFSLGSAREIAHSERRCESRSSNITLRALFFEHYSSNMGTWRWSSVGPRLGRRVAPITARTVSDSSAVRGTKMRWVLERWSGGFTR